MADIPHPFVVETMTRLAALDAAERAKVRLIHLNHTNPLLDADSQASHRVQQAGLQVAKQFERFEL